MNENEKSSYRGYTEAQARAAKKYRQGKGEFKVIVSPEKKAEFQEAAAAAGLSLNQFAIVSMDEKIARSRL